MPERKLRVFLCHASQDKPMVRELYKKLDAEGWIDPWLDEEKLLPGEDWDMEIEKAVESADAVVVCLSKNSVSKEGYVQKELKYALNIALMKPEETIFILPLKLDDCSVPRSLQSIQYIDYYPVNRKGWAYKRLQEALRIRLGQLLARETEEQARKDAEENKRREAEERARKRAEESARRRAEEKSQREAEAHRQAEDREKRLVEEIALKRTEEKELENRNIGVEELFTEEAYLLHHLERMHSEYSLIGNDLLENKLWQSLPEPRKVYFNRVRIVTVALTIIIELIIIIVLIASNVATWIIVLAGLFAVGFAGIGDGIVKRIALDPELKKRIEIQKDKLKKLQ
jgi:flagellar biosynthesis GTPase FlhF